MNQAGTNLKNFKVPTVSSGMIGGVVFFIVLIIVLYYIYTFLYSSGGVQSSINVVPSSVLDTTKLKNGGVIRSDAATRLTSGDSAVAQVVQAKGLSSGGQYTVTMWLSVYSTSPQTSGTGTIPLLDITAANQNTLLFVGLQPTDGTLVVNQGTGDAKDPVVGKFGLASPSSSSRSSLTSSSSPSPSSSSSFSSSVSPISSVSPSSSASATPMTTVYTGTDKCNIVNGIEYQRWVLIGIVSNGRTLDVYIDGKLSRSCVYNGMNSLGVTTGTADITVGRQTATSGSINGVFSTTEYYNYALTPDIMWGIYQTGPATTSTGSFFSNLFSTNIDLSMGTAKN